MSIARRPLLTAVAAGALLCALWFVPSANANAAPAPERPRTGWTHGITGPGGGEQSPPRLADTGSFDSTPYIIGGTGFLAVGIAFVTYAVRRGHAPAPVAPGAEQGTPPQH
ncbi:hypothetical protein AB0G74_13515 [Streptomyces sp. NPDC020875]|uniref:hypothetical protein n=1 Tax=Streptomyces sp. NPDC020875 TaxID=3154898 RepID=UPI0033C0F538